MVAISGSTESSSKIRRAFDRSDDLDDLILSLPHVTNVSKSAIKIRRFAGELNRREQVRRARRSMDNMYSVSLARSIELRIRNAFKRPNRSPLIASQAMEQPTC